jgi:hypothetical protein
MSGTTNGFQTVNGQIIDPNGQPFVARGIDISDGEEPSVSTLQSQFPGVNFVRLAVADYASPQTLSAYVNALTSAGIVVEIENHNNGAGNAGGDAGQEFSGQTLANESAWYASVASAFKNNPYVWFGTNNEPSTTDAAGNYDLDGLANWQLDTYHAIRDTGNTSPIMLEPVMTYGGQGGMNIGLPQSVYSQMSNTIWDLHYYGWIAGYSTTNPNGGYSTDQNVVNQSLATLASQAQAITSANGTMPVIVGEYGNSTTGVSVDQNGNQIIASVLQAAQSGVISGSAAWFYDRGNPGDGLITSSGNLSTYGQQIAANIATLANEEPASAPVAVSSAAPVSSAAAVVAPTANAVLLAGSTTGMTDAGGNVWTITNGVVDVNGAAAGYSKNVTELAAVNGNVYQENSAGNWWEWSGNTWGTGPGTATSPLPATASANDTVGSTLTDGAGNAWTISNGIVDENGTAAGYSANVTQLAYANGDVYQQNAAGNWWEWSNNTWGTGPGTATSPVPTTAAATTPDTISVSTGGATQAVAGLTGTVDGDTFSLTATGVTQATLGANPSFIAFTGSSGVSVTGGTSGAIVTATTGTNTFTAGAGMLAVTGGTGADSYVFGAGAGFLAVTDFASAKGDTLSIASSLQGSMTTASDGSGGTLISFGGNAGIDLLGVSTAPTIHWS